MPITPLSTKPTRSQIQRRRRTSAVGPTPQSSLADSQISGLRPSTSLVAGKVPRPAAQQTESTRRIACNFAFLSVAEIGCRVISMAVMLSLPRRLGQEGYGRIEFAFNIVYWLVLLVREGLDVIATREIARHPRLIRPLVNHILAIRGCLAACLFSGLMLGGTFAFSGATERTILWIYGILLLTTAVGLDFVYRGLERMGLVAVSLLIRTTLYATGVILWVTDSSKILLVPAFLVIGELTGIALVWACYLRQYGIPKLTLRATRALRTILRRGRPVYLIQVSQAVINSSDLIVVGILSGWADLGFYCAPHRIVTAALTFGIIFRQVVFPSLARTWRSSASEGREAFNGMVRALMIGLVPIAVGATALADPLIALLLGDQFEGAGLLLALGCWRIPILTLAFLYQSALIALNREALGMRILIAAALVTGPIAGLLWMQWGLHGAVVSVPVVGLVLFGLGYHQLAIADRAPSWHHHLAKPAIASMAMVPVALWIAQWHVLPAIAGGALTYCVVLTLIGGLSQTDLQRLLGRTS